MYRHWTKFEDCLHLEGEGDRVIPGVTGKENLTPDDSKAGGEDSPCSLGWADQHVATRYMWLYKCKLMKIKQNIQHLGNTGHI